MNSAIDTGSRGLWKWFIVLVAPFLLNDFANINVHNFLTWLAIDYVFVKAFPLLIFFYLIRSRIITLEDLGLRKISIAQFAFWTVTMAVLGYCLVRFGRQFLYTFIPFGPIGGIPRDFDSIFFTIDLYLGILLVGLLEEMIFRGLAFTILRKFGLSIPVILVLSSLLFGLIHWSFGLVQIIVTSLFGGIYMIYRWKADNITPLIFAHFLVDYVIFSGIIR